MTYDPSKEFHAADIVRPVSRHAIQIAGAFNSAEVISVYKDPGHLDDLLRIRWLKPCLDPEGHLLVDWRAHHFALEDRSNMSDRPKVPGFKKGDRVIYIPSKQIGRPEMHGAVYDVGRDLIDVKWDNLERPSTHSPNALEVIEIEDRFYDMMED
jgi:hypothetical protein